VRDVFAEVIMNVLGTKDLYEAWEKSYQATIDDYRTTEVIFCFKNDIGRSNSGYQG